MFYRGRNKKELFLAALLYDSVEFRHDASIESLLTEKKADPNLILPSKGICSLHLAVGCHSEDFALGIVSLMLQNGGNPNVKSDDDGLTPVHVATIWERTKILDLLLRNGGDPEMPDMDGKTAFKYAVENTSIECLSLLTDYLPNKSELIHRDESDRYSLALEKILVSNGVQIGEYMEEPANTSIIQLADRLPSLPQTNPTEYILNWVSEQKQLASDSSSNSDLIESIARSLGSDSTFECSDNSLMESDCDESKRYDARFINFRKVYRKKRSKSSRCQTAKTPKGQPNRNSASPTDLDDSHYTDAYSISQLKEYSGESGVVTIQSLLDSNQSRKLNNSKERTAVQEKNSDYFTCSHNSIISLEKNIFEITDDLSDIRLDVIASDPKQSDTGASETSFVSVSEVYKYVDMDEDVVLYEKRLMKAPSEFTKSASSNVSSTLSSLPPNFDYDAKMLKKELIVLGYEPGPITSTTKRVYLKKLHHMRKNPSSELRLSGPQNNKRVYSLELEKTMKNMNWSDDAALKRLEEDVVRQFHSSAPTIKWREGTNKSNFTYLLLDPRITNNLPDRAGTLSPLDQWQTFLSAIFYVGKGKRSRPYQHLYDAVNLWKKGQLETTNRKLQRIIDVWKGDCGVVCLHVFQNVIPVEAYTREAAMISALKLENLTNIKSGEFYGVAASWPNRQKKLFGAYLLYKSMMILLHEGERQLCPMDIN
uniref:LEM domain-containing protein n=2 Tax=Dendroctonus ponderosae TaxID=77166 RepID=A0AAR5QFQ0_DENPD